MVVRSLRLFFLRWWRRDLMMEMKRDGDPMICVCERSGDGGMLQSCLTERSEDIRFVF